MATKRTIIEIELVGGEKVKVDFDKIGESSQRALKKLLDSGKPVPATLRAVEGAAKDLLGTAGSLATRLGPLGAGLAAIGPAGLAAAGAAGAVGGLFIVAKRAIETASALQDTSDRLGIGVEALQEYQFAAQQSGVDQETLNTSIGIFTQRVGQAKAGVGPLVAGLKEHDKALLENIRNARSMDEALRIAFEALAQEEDAAKKAALANTLFGRSGRELGPMADTFKEIAVQARELGLILDAETVAAAEKAGDKLELLGKVMSINLMRAVLQLTPLIDTLATSMITGAEKAIDFAEALGLIEPAAAAAADQNFAGRLAAISIEMDGVRGKIAQLGEGSKLIKPLNDELAALEAQQKKIIEARAAQRAPKTAADKPVPLGPSVEELEAQKKAAKEFESEQKKIRGDLMKLHEQSLTAELEGIAKIEAARDQEIAKYQAALETKLITEQEFAQARTDLEKKAQAEITKIQEVEQEKRDKARADFDELVKESEREHSIVFAEESEKRRIEFDAETEEFIRNLEEKGAAAGASQEEITRQANEHRQRREEIYREEVKNAKTEFLKLSDVFSDVMSEIATGLLRGTRDGSIGDILKDAGIAIGLKLVEGTIEQKLSSTGIDKLLSTNLFELGASLPGLLVDGFMGQGGLGGLVDAVLGQKGGLDSTIASTVTGQGGAAGGGGGLLGNAASLIGSGTLLASATGTITGLAGTASVASLADAGLIHLAADAAGNIVIGLGPGAAAVAVEGGVAGGAGAGAGAGAGGAAGSAAGGLSSTGIGAIVAAAVLGAIQTYSSVNRALEGDVLGGWAQNALDPLGILGMAGVDIANVLGISHIPTKGTQFRQGVGGELSKIFPDLELLMEQFDEAEERFPDLFKSALPPVRALATAIAEMADTPLETADEVAQLTNILINSLAAEGKGAADAVALSRKAMEQLGLSAEETGTIAVKAMTEGRISVEEFEQVVLGLAEIAGVPFEVMRDAILAAITDAGELRAALIALGEIDFGHLADVHHPSAGIEDPGARRDASRGDRARAEADAERIRTGQSLAVGGYVSGPMGSEQIIRAHGGELVLPLHDRSSMAAWAARLGGGGNGELTASMRNVEGLLAVLVGQTGVVATNTGTPRTIAVRDRNDIPADLVRLERENRIRLGLTRPVADKSTVFGHRPVR